MEPFEDNCPIPSTHAKCNEARYFLIECLFHYHYPQQFLFNLNAFIQAIRNITFMLQSEDAKPIGFKEWYEAKQKEMQNNPTLRRLVYARNIVVKKSSLKSKSKVMCGLFRGRRMKMSISHDIYPFIKTEELMEITSKFINKTFLGGKHTTVGEQAGIERKWVVEELGDGEVIAQCLDALNYMISLVEEAHQLFNRTSGIEQLGIYMTEYSVLLETDLDPTLIQKWGWNENS
jgi:hypothetical protein